MRVRAAALAAGIVMAGASAWAAESGKSGPDLARGQKIATEVCAACHGADGNSVLPANPKLAARVREADVLLLIGGRMSEMPSSSYTLIDIPEPKQALVHVT